MAIARDASSGFQTSGGAWNVTSVSSITWSHTCSGANRVLVVAASGDAPATAVTGVTYNGVSLTNINTLTSGGVYVSLWYLIAPDTGAHDIVISYNGTCSHPIGFGISLTGAKQSAQPDSNNTAHIASNTHGTVATTVVDANSWVIGYFMSAGATTSDTADSGTTFVVDWAAGGFRMTDSNGGVAAGSTPQGMTHASAIEWWTTIASIAPVASTNVTVSADVVTGTFSIPASTISGGAVVSPTAVVGTLSVQAPTVSGGATVSADVVSGTFSLPTPDIQTPDAYVAADVISATFSIPAPTVTAIENVSISADLLTGTLSLPAATAVIAVSVASDVLTAVFTLPEVTVTAIGNVTISPSVLTGTLSLPVSTVEAIRHVTVSTDAVTGTFSLPAPTITAIRTVVISADLLTGVLSLPIMTIAADQWQPQYTEPTATSWGAQYGGVGSVSWDNKY